jgi:hypothetical protein
MASKIETFEMDGSTVGELRAVLGSIEDVPADAVVRVSTRRVDIFNRHGLQLRTVTVEYRTDPS